MFHFDVMKGGWKTGVDGQNVRWYSKEDGFVSVVHFMLRQQAAWIPVWDTEPPTIFLKHWMVI